MEAKLDLAHRLIDGLLALLLAVMVVLVFGNVVLRYGFNSGITASEEISRWAFVWMTFLGALVALREHTHLGTDILISRLPRLGKRICLGTGVVLMIGTTCLLFSGSLAQVKVNLKVMSPVTGTSMGYFYAAGVVFAIPATLLLLWEFWRIATDRLRDEDLVMVRESEELTRVGPQSR